MSDLQNASGAYALNALSDSESAEFETLLAADEQLRNEVTELTDTAVELGLSVAPVDPPASLRASILDAVASTPQASPRVEERAVGTRLETPAERKARARWSTPLVRIGAVAASIVLIAGIALGVNAGLGMQADLATAQQISQIQAAEDYQHRTVEVSTGGSATLVWSLALERSALLVDGLKGLPAGSTYELWYIDADGATPAGTFDGQGDVVLAGDMSAGDSIGVTVEPAGGSTSPGLTQPRRSLSTLVRCVALSTLSTGTVVRTVQGFPDPQVSYYQRDGIWLSLLGRDP
jgi:anti-sigma-K factor RskA